MNKVLISKKYRKDNSRLSQMSYVFFLTVLTASTFLLSDCSSTKTEQYQKPKASHGSVYKVDDDTYECTWQLIEGRTKKKCVRK